MQGSNGGNKKHVPLRNQTFDSNGPDVRIRGNAHQVYEKYLALARDATAQGDRVAAENYFQHAEHYYRIINAHASQQPVRQPRADQGADGENGTGQDGQENLSDSAELDAALSSAERGESGNDDGGDSDRDNDGDTDSDGDTTDNADSEEKSSSSQQNLF